MRGLMKVGGIIAGLCLAMATALPAAAQEWPARPVKVVVPYGPGSTPDTVARVVADILQKKFGGSFVVENKSGASGNLGTGAIAKAEPDGYTIGVSIAGPLAVNTVLFPDLPYDPFTDISPIAVAAHQASVLVVNSDLGVDTLREFLDLLKREPNKFNYGSVGTGSISHLAMEVLATKSGSRPVHVPFRGSPKALTAILQGDVQMGILPAGTVGPHAASSDVKLLAVTTEERSSVLPDVPTIKEAGGPDINADAWVGLVAPAGTDPVMIDKINKAVVEGLKDPAAKERLNAQFMEPGGSTPEELGALMKADLERWKPVIKAGNIRLN